jgi:hypothetical protein
MNDSQSIEDEEWFQKEQTALERICDEATEPFTIEPFCAQVAWMKPKTCPVYPIFPSSDVMCSYLVDDGYEDYRCPNARLPLELARPIIEKGTQEQKDALEFLADMYARYGSMANPPAERDDFCLGNAIEIYFGLGCIKKAEALLNRFPSYRKILLPPY